MQESNPMSNIEARNKIRALAREIGGRALSDEALLQKIIDFSKNLKDQNPDHPGFVLLHDLGRGKVSEDIQKFIQELAK